MPARKRVDEDEESSEVSSSEDDDGSSSEASSSEEESSEEESSEDETPAVNRASAGGTQSNVVANKPHDEEFAVENQGERGGTPPTSGGAPPPAAQNLQPSASGTNDGNKIANAPHDEEFTVDGGDAAAGGSQTQPATTAQPQRKPSVTVGGSNVIKNDPNDEAFDVEDDMSSSSEEDEDEDDDVRKPPPAGGNNLTSAAGGNTGSQILRNTSHDETFDVDSPGKQSTPGTSTAGSPPKSIAPLPQRQTMQPAGGNDDDEETSSDEDTATDEDEDDQPTGFGPGNAELQQTTATNNNSSVEYNPEDYAHLNSKVSRDVRDCFSHITAYQPQSIELPAKLRPFIPEYIPCVGDIDTFCKVPRPDEKPDNLGLMVVDEPSCEQSNPFVTKIALGHLVGGSHKTLADANVAMIDDAQKRPQMIDKWITDIKHVSKQLPTVTYSKPMPQIEQLMQIWPKEFEDMLNSDVAFPGPGIDLDIEQYVRLLCTMMDIPCYGNLVESLHVMFTLYLEFRANQHFQHT